MALGPDTLEELRRSVARFVDELLIPSERQVEEEERVPAEIVAEMKALGLFGLTIPEEYGGLGLAMAEEVVICFELGRASPAFRSIIGTTVGIGSQGIVIDGTDAQRQRYLPLMARGELIGSFCLTEPDAGSDAASLKTRARRDGDHYVIDGRKRFITNAPVAGIFTVMARSDPENKGAGGISAFLVEAGTPGLSIGKIDKKMGQRGSLTADVVFENCRVPAMALIGGREGIGFKTAMKVLDRGRLHLAAVCTGLAERLIAEAVGYAREREQFGKKIGEFQLIQAMLADSRTEAYAARCMVLDAAKKRDGGADIRVEAACCKYFASEMVGRIADRAVQIFGGAGYMADYPVEHLYRDARLFRLYEGTSQIQQILIGRSLIAGG
ncbi:MAG TPA: acyl-CoA dehydrogenase family protein [Stellaceae bacterium]|nr:acyl-CoA dehydrogenase family protein [Stellaceae bacterium]